MEKKLHYTTLERITFFDEFPRKAWQYDDEQQKFIISKFAGKSGPAIRCAVCGQVKPRTEFERGGTVCRCNCQSCYEMSANGFIELERRYDEALWKDRHSTHSLTNGVFDQLLRAKKVSDLITELSNLDPEAVVIVGGGIGFSIETTEKLGFSVVEIS